MSAIDHFKAARKPRRGRRGATIAGDSSTLEQTREHPKVATAAYSYSPLDAYKSKRPPSQVELVAAYRLLTYACANINARAVAQTHLRLYATTTRRLGQKRARWGIGQPVAKRMRGRWECSPADRPRLDWLLSSPLHAKRLAQADELEEIAEHPVLEVLDYVNPWMDRYSLIELRQLYLEICGASYWTFVDNSDGSPAEIWPLPSWMVYPQPDFAGQDVILRYIFTGGAGQTVYDPRRVFYERGTNLFDPYTQPWGPLRAAYELTQVYDKRVESEDAFLTNESRPGAAFIPDKELGPLPYDEVIRMNLQFSELTARANQGGIVTMPFDGKLQPFNWPGRDDTMIHAQEMSRADIALMMDVPIGLVDAHQQSKANLEATIRWHATNATKPRCRKGEEGLNSNFLPRFPEADATRLFLAFDDPVPADQVLERENHKAYVDMGVQSRNAVAMEKGWPTFEGGDEIMVPNNLVPLATAVQPPDPRVIVPIAGPRPDETDDDAQGPKEGEAETPTDPAFAEDEHDSATKRLNDHANGHADPAALAILKARMGGPPAVDVDETRTIAKALAVLDWVEERLTDDPALDPAVALELVEKLNCDVHRL